MEQKTLSVLHTVFFKYCRCFAFQGVTAATAKESESLHSSDSSGVFVRLRAF